MKLKEILNLIIINDEKNTINKENAYRFVNELEGIVNTFTLKIPEMFGELDSIEKTRLFMLALYWIKYLADGNIRTDGRNQASAEMCKRIAQMPEFKKAYTYYCDDYDFAADEDTDVVYMEAYLIMYNARIHMHHTLLQSATSIMLYSLSQVNDGDAKEITKKLEEEYGDRWYRFPMI